MAGQGQRGSREHGRSSRRGSSVALAAAADGPGSEALTSAANPVSAANPAPATAPTPSPRQVSRLLQMKGMTPDEAANLTAFLYGLPTADLHWSLKQLNQLLFLRQMRQTGRFGGGDGGRDLPH